MKNTGVRGDKPLQLQSIGSSACCFLEILDNFPQFNHTSKFNKSEVSDIIKCSCIHAQLITIRP